MYVRDALLAHQLLVSVRDKYALPNLQKHAEDRKKLYNHLLQDSMSLRQPFVIHLVFATP